jgi:predicted glutamine amidotransferase
MIQFVVISSSPETFFKRIPPEGGNDVCELLGISSSEKVSLAPYWEIFRKRGKKFREGAGNPDGWGLAVYPDGKGALVIKEDLPGATSKLSKFLSTYDLLKSKIIIGHVRKASRGAVRFSNSHPFSRELGGVQYVLAHNGTIRGSRRLSLGRFTPVGSTDSERLFCSLLDHIDKDGIRSWSEKNLFGLRDFLLTTNRRPTRDEAKPNKINLLLSDGTTLICYNDSFGRGTLHRLMIPFCETLHVGNTLSDQANGDDRIPKRSLVVLATRPLDNDPGWVAMQSGELCALRDGQLVFSSGKAGTR